MSTQHLLINEPSEPSSKRCLTDPQTSSDSGQTKRRKTSSCSSISSPVALSNEILVESIKFLDFNKLNLCREVVRRWNNLIVENRPHLALQFLNHSFTMDFNEYNRELTRCLSSQLTCLQTCSKTWTEKGNAVMTQLTDKPIVLTNTESKDLMLIIRDESQTRGSSRQLSLVFVAQSQHTTTPPIMSAYFNEGITTTDTLPHILHWFKHLTSSITYLSEINLMPFDLSLLNTCYPNARIHAKEITIAGSGTEDLDWLLSFAQKHCRCHTLIWTFEKIERHGQHSEEAKKADLQRSEQLEEFLLSASSYITSIEIIDLPVLIALYLCRSIIEKFTSSDINGLLYNIQLNGYQRSANPITCASSFISADQEPSLREKRIGKELKSKNFSRIMQVEIDVSKEFYDVELTIEMV